MIESPFFSYNSVFQEVVFSREEPISMTHAQPAFKILTWGCQMNDDDSQQMANLLEQMGYRRTSKERDADVILLNTCSVRAKPEQKVRSKLGELRLLKQEKRGLVIGVCGCMAQREGERLLKGAPCVDLVMGTAAIYDLPVLIERVRQGRGQVVATDLPERGKSNGTAHVRRTVGRVGLKTFVPIMYGCNNFCAYCVVPDARGPERSRPPEEIVAEVTELASRGCKEVMLVGQNVNSYGKSSAVSPSMDSGQDSQPPERDFAALLRLLNDVPALERVRFITSHPKDLSDRLIDTMAELPKVCEHLHLPIQAGDDEILRRMGRRYTVEHYMKLVEKLRDRIPGLSLTTDVMVGFPGETEEQFTNTLNAVRQIRFDAAFMFAFNPRPGTAAARMDDQIDKPTKRRRLSELIALQNQITLEKNQAQVGRAFEVLVEGVSEKNPNRMTGYTRTHKTVNFPGGPELTGRLVMVRAKSAHPWGFGGELTE